MPALLACSLEILFLLVCEDEVERQEPGFDVREFVLPAIAEMFFADRGIDLSRTELENEASAGISPGTGVALAEQLLYQSGIPFAALGKIEELPNREIARMRGHKVEKTGFHFGVAEGAELADFVF
ncbi:MAG TPA: hypothetical protein VGR55_18830 [Candidatus Acidoferrum sp.]|nr:hypothetical protein [Candidatus Acidoferrum sp.]